MSYIRNKARSLDPSSGISETKNFLFSMEEACVPFRGMDHQKFNFLLIFGTFMSEAFKASLCNFLDFFKLADRMRSIRMTGASKNRDWRYTNG